MYLHILSIVCRPLCKILTVIRIWINQEVIGKSNLNYLKQMNKRMIIWKSLGTAHTFEWTMPEMGLKIRSCPLTALPLSECWLHFLIPPSSHGQKQSWWQLPSWLPLHRHSQTGQTLIGLCWSCVHSWRQSQVRSSDWPSWVTSHSC